MMNIERFKTTCWPEDDYEKQAEMAWAIMKHQMELIKQQANQEKRLKHIEDCISKAASEMKKEPT